MRNALALASILALTACTVGPDYKGPRIAFPESWSSPSQPEQKPVSVIADAPLPLNWWTLFNDPTLTAYIEEGLKHNADIEIAAARVAEARAILRLADANYYPEISGQAAGQRIGGSRESRMAGGSGRTYNNFSVSAILDYEIDVWGKFRRTSEAARGQWLAQKANRDAVRLAVASDIATGYFNLLALDGQVRVARNTIATRKSGTDYQRKQYNAGQIDVLTIRRAEAELAAAEATLPQLEQALAEQQQALSLLLGRSPQEIVSNAPKASRSVASLPVAPVMPADAPSTLLQRRPDIYAAEQSLVAANADIGVAIANYYPSFSLSALLGLASGDIDRLLRSSARTWDAGASAAMPILDFGRTGANVDAAKARYEQALASYKQAVRQAAGDVSNALSAIRTSQDRAAAQARQVRANEETVRAARLRYNAGYATQLDKLDAERQLFQAQLDQIDAERERLTATVTLYKAIGGGWADPVPVEEAAEDNAPPSEAAAAEKEPRQPARPKKKPAAPVPFKMQRR